MSDACATLCRQLAASHSAVANMLTEHLQDYEELLPHVLFGEITRYVVAGGAQRRSIVEALEQALSGGDPDVENLIGVSFIENIETELELEHSLAGLPAPALRAEWHMQHSA